MPYYLFKHLALSIFSNNTGADNTYYCIRSIGDVQYYIQTPTDNVNTFPCAMFYFTLGGLSNYFAIKYTVDAKDALWVCDPSGSE